MPRSSAVGERRGDFRGEQGERLQRILVADRAEDEMAQEQRRAGLGGLLREELAHGPWRARAPEALLGEPIPFPWKLERKRDAPLVPERGEGLAPAGECGARDARRLGVRLCDDEVARKPEEWQVRLGAPELGPLLAIAIERVTRAAGRQQRDDVDALRCGP